MFSYLNPAGTTAIPGKTLPITHISLGETIAMAAASTNGIIALLRHRGRQYVERDDGDRRCGGGGGAHHSDRAMLFHVRRRLERPAWARKLISPSRRWSSRRAYFTFIVRPVGTVTSNTLTVTGSVGFTDTTHESRTGRRQRRSRHVLITMLHEYWETMGTTDALEITRLEARTLSAHRPRYGVVRGV